MSRAQIESVLASHDTGVLSLGVSNRGYGFPISYSFDADADRVVVGFVSSPESKKTEFAAAAEEATFTVFDYDDVDSWQSVIATGPIDAVDEDAGTVPDLFFRPDDETTMVDLDEFERSWYALDAAEISGRYSGD